MGFGRLCTGSRINRPPRKCSECRKPLPGEPGIWESVDGVCECKRCLGLKVERSRKPGKCGECDECTGNLQRAVDALRGKLPGEPAE